MTEDVEQFFNEKTGMNLTPVFEQYLRHTAIPTLELKFDAPPAASNIAGKPTSRASPCPYAWERRTIGK